jgi:nicotinate-nucleotide--dimethylbenzimidazole phosphoribosyltransferase
MRFETELAQAIQSVRSVDRAGLNPWDRLDGLTKPPRSLGRLEEIAAQVARVQQTDHPDVGRKAVLLMAGDHGVVAEGVAPYPQAVTVQMVANFSAGGAAINQIANSVGADVVVYDIGVAEEVSDIRGVVAAKVAMGTANMACGPAMTREQCAEAVMVGIRAAREAADKGYRLLGLGEMGIGNSTAAAALTAAFTGEEPRTVVGPGTGLAADAVAKKADVVARALAVNSVSDIDPLGILSGVGGLEIAALAGVVIGGADSSVVVVSDGYISGAATLAALAMCPAASDYVLASHLSTEPGHAVLLAHLGMAPVLTLDMRLGEGSGAALAMAVIDAACAMMSGMATFEEAGVSEAEFPAPAEAVAKHASGGAG